MICNNCNAEIAEGSQFCMKCGNKVQDLTCKHCGTKLEPGSKFCSKCGLHTWIKEPAVQQPAAQRPVPAPSTYSAGDYTGSKTVAAYTVSVIGAIVSFIIRLIFQTTYYSYENLLENRKLVGLDSDIKPFFTVLPVAAAIIALLLIVSDQETGTRKKHIAMIVNAIFIVLAVLFIWFDIPYQIINF